MSSVHKQIPTNYAETGKTQQKGRASSHRKEEAGEAEGTGGGQGSPILCLLDFENLGFRMGQVCPS